MASLPLPPRAQGGLSALVALGFQGIGLAALLGCLAVVILSPGVLSGDPYRMEVLALGVLALAGFAASFVFGSFYAVSSLLSGAGLWSRPLALLHLLLHSLGLSLLTLGLGGLNFLDQPFLPMGTGAILILAGMLLLLLNLVATASQRNRWEPAQITVLFSLFWLGMAAVLGLALFIHIRYPLFREDPVRLLETYATLGVVGFLWLGLLGASLKLLEMFCVGQLRSSSLSWAGCLLINAGLFFLVAMPQRLPWNAYAIPAGLGFLGSMAFLVDMLRLVTGNRALWNPGLAAALLGLLSGVLTLGGLLWSMTSPDQTGETLPADLRAQVRTFLVLVLFGAVALVSLGFGTRLIPFLIWRIRCLPLVRQPSLPAVSDWIDLRSLPAFALCLLLSLGYLAAGQWLDHPAGAQLGMVCLLTGIFWFLFSLRVALQAFFLGVEPASPTPHLPASLSS